MHTTHSALNDLYDNISIACPQCEQAIPLQQKSAFSIDSCPFCGGQYEVPLQVEHLLLESKISDNGVVTAYRGTDLLLNRAVMVKKLNKIFYNVDNHSPQFPFLECSGAVNVFSTVIYEGEIYMVSEMIDGTSIRSYLDNKRLIAQPKVISLALAISGTLAEAAEMDVHHGHLLPESIWVDNNGEVRLVDFMLYHNILSDVQNNARVSKILDVRYSANSRLLTNKISERSDLFSFGVCLYEMLCGELPNNSTSVDEITAERKLTPFSGERLEAIGINERLVYLVVNLLTESGRFNTFNEVTSFLEKAFIEPSSAPVKKQSSSSGQKKKSSGLKVGRKTPSRSRKLSSKNKLKNLFR